MHEEYFDKLIFSSHLPPHEVMQCLMDGNKQFRVTLSYYDNEKEVAYIVEANSFSYLKEHGLLTQQASVLFLGTADPKSKGREASVLFVEASDLKEKVLPLGRFLAVPRAVAEAQPGWCFEPVSGQWFTILSEEAA
jgi:hypothetical protein